MMHKIFAVLKYQYERINRFKKSCRENGLRNALSRILTFGKELIYLSKNGYLFELESLETVYKPAKKFKYKVVEIKKAIDLSHLIVDLTLENVKYRLDSGEYVFVAFYNNRPIGTLWLTNKPTYFPGFEYRIASRSKWVDLGEATGFLYRAAVDKDFRGNHIMSAIRNEVLSKAKELGLKRLITSQGVDNVSARKSSLRGGWRVKDYVICRRICGVLFRKLIPMDRNV